MARRKDVEAKKFFSHNKYFGDVFNFCLFNGKHVIGEDDLRELDTSVSITIKNQKKVTAIQKQRDLLKEVVFSQKESSKYNYCILGIENQSHVTLDMILRNMLYDVLEYVRQAEILKVKNIEEGSKDVEFFSGLKKTDRLKPVITIVVNLSNEPWYGPKSLKEMTVDLPESIACFFNDYKLYVLDPYQITDEELNKFNTDLRAVMGCIKHQNDKDLSFLQDHIYSNVDEESANLIQTFTRIKTRKTDTTKDGGRNMCKAYEREVRKRINEGIEIGERKGIKIGESRGIKIGESRGIKIGESRGIKIGESRGIKIGEENGKQKALNELKKLVDSLKNNNIEFDAFRIISDDDYRNNMLALINH